MANQTAWKIISGGKRWPLKAPEYLAFVMSVGMISEQARQVDDALEDHTFSLRCSLADNFDENPRV